MKHLAVLMTVFLSLEANATFDCTVSIFSNGKKVDESALQLKPDKKNKDYSSAEKSGYVFDMVINESDPNQIEKLIVTEKATDRSSISGLPT